MKKLKAGRKPIADKKRAVTIYVKDSDIKQLGGLAALRISLLNYAFSRILETN
jgi:hypothetical protein